MLIESDIGWNKSLSCHVGLAWINIAQHVKLLTQLSRILRLIIQLIRRVVSLLLVLLTMIFLMAAIKLNIAEVQIIWLLNTILPRHTIFVFPSISFSSLELVLFAKFGESILFFMSLLLLLLTILLAKFITLLVYDLDIWLGKCRLLILL